ncbi:uncharacterized protein PRCAT00004250001 [Priceomyces carsonii]|uniref:uncharacterized protein n=1 Tax=Priceomyces carsonii TaxID=28549 RepID=UPI002EDB8EDD|nr:unnamed protein product [Priceomyces carsonii]
MDSRVSEKKKRGKRKNTYSRKGCIVCKLRKLKCDESFPRCLNCLKGSRDCSYKQIAKFSKSRSFTIDDDITNPENNNDHNKAFESTAVCIQKADNLLGSAVSDPVISAIPHGEGNKSLHDTSSDFTTSSDQNGLMPQEHNLNHNSKTNFCLASLFGDDLEFDKILMDDATSLTQGLNDYGNFEFDQFSINVPPNLSIISKAKYSSVQKDSHRGDKTDIRIQQLISSYDLIDVHKNYIRLFKDKYSLWIMPLCSESKNICAQILLAQALDFPFLLYAILSITARYENFLSENSEDEQFLKFYFFQCCEQFARIFEDKEHISGYIEPLILTTLLLVTDAAAFINGDWRAHLKAAHSLLSKYVDAYKKTSSVIVLSRSWFAILEILAIAANPSGGAITSQGGLEMISNILFGSKDTKLAIEMGLLLPNGYSISLGYTREAVDMFITFVRITLRLKENKVQKVSADDLLALMGQIEIAKKSYFATDNCLIPENHAYHPNNATGMLFPPSTYSWMGNNVFSWFDISHKVHVQALYLKVLVDESFLNIPIESPIVQDVVAEILSYCHFFRRINFTDSHFSLKKQLESTRGDEFWQDHRLINCHWPLLTCGLCCLNRIDKLKIEFYFCIMIQMGARSFERSFENVKNKWNGVTELSDCVPFC